MSHFCGRSPQGECGLKCADDDVRVDARGRSPQGECGLKYVKPEALVAGHGSLPARGVWIEIACVRFRVNSPPVAPRKGSVD